MVMGSTRPAAMYWGPEFVAIYNEAYISVIGDKHPGFMGMRYRDAWDEIWGQVRGAFDAAWCSCQATTKQEDRLFIYRNGFLEETYFSWSIVPLVGTDGSVVALYNPASEVTHRKLNERRTLTLHEVGGQTSRARSVKEFWARVESGLRTNGYDVPFALVYSVGQDPESDVCSVHSAGPDNLPRVVLEGSLGVPHGHPVASPLLDLRTAEVGFAPHMRESLSRRRSAVVLRHEDGTLPDELAGGVCWRGFGEPCRNITVIPVHPTAVGDAVVGFVILGANPRRPYDDSYELFVDILGRQLATSFASVLLVEEEIRQGERAAQLAALDRQRLSAQLQLRTQEAVESEYKFTRMAEFAPVGMFIADGHGRITYVNDTWWLISGHPRSPDSVDRWMQSIRDDDRPGVEEVWGLLVNDKVAITHEFRFKRSSGVSDGHVVDTWVLMSAYPDKGDAGHLKSIFGCITDISQQKWAGDVEKKRREEAVELKRQKENFIDITSHEMRNPLGAILQCADEISENLTNFASLKPFPNTMPSNLGLLLDSCIEASNTISLCANHQKRIVDDILTLSKLDSQLLLVTPVDTRPAVVVEKVLRMFERELRSQDIESEFRIDKSFVDSGGDWYKLDPSRLGQVLINLMTNAIKFTQGREKRTITISLSLSEDIPESGPCLPARTSGLDLVDEADWGDGEKVNLRFAVSDTGPGLDDGEKKILFQRFSQTTPRTHVQYGGSGLGLFICRTLTELQGGRIGVTSEKGVGSTFAFYVKSRRGRNPTKANEEEAPRGTRHSSLMRGAPDQSPPHKPSGHTPLDILIVEDNLVNQRVLQRQLRMSGNNTHVANHGSEALEALRRSRFWNRPPSEDDIDISVILLDLEMPVMDGMTCARKIRELERAGTLSRHIPIIAVTAYARSEQIASAKAAGADDVISKPFRVSELLPKIQELVSKHGALRPTGKSSHLHMPELETCDSVTMEQ